MANTANSTDPVSAASNLVTEDEKKSTPPRGKKEESPKAKEKEKKDPVMQQEQPEEYNEEEEYDEDYDLDLYEMDPGKIPHDVAINVHQSPFFIHQTGKTSRKLTQGQRVRGLDFRKMVTKEKIDRLALCYKQNPEFLKKLEEARIENMGITKKEWFKEAHMRKRNKK